MILLPVLVACCGPGYLALLHAGMSAHQPCGWPHFSDCMTRCSFARCISVNLRQFYCAATQGLCAMPAIPLRGSTGLLKLQTCSGALPAFYEITINILLLSLACSAGRVRNTRSRAHESRRFELAERGMPHRSYLWDDIRTDTLAAACLAYAASSLMSRCLGTSSADISTSVDNSAGVRNKQMYANSSVTRRQHVKLLH
jgi:hypothetical protein